MSYQTVDKNGNVIEKGGLYKLKEGKSLDKTEEYLSNVVRFYDFLMNPLIEGDEKYYVYFDYVFEGTVRPTSYILPSKILPYDSFFEYFELYKTGQEVNEIILRTMNEEERNDKE